ncbi:MAG TPA: hypothetical protein VMD78_04110 [Candidatus Baltobacteraceae bacterium]|nr:hypothetical protein [Candidatus Baltobacteraceae bacterium]
MNYLLEIEPLDLGPGVKAVGLELAENDENREPVRGPDAARIWSRVLPATAGQEPWALDFFSHLDRVRDFCDRHGIAYREAGARSLVIPAPAAEALEPLIDRFQAETFGARAGGSVVAGDAALEGDLARRGVDAYDKVYASYFFCAVCGFENGSLVVLSEKLWASEVIRRVKPVLKDLDVEILLPA